MTLIIAYLSVVLIWATTPLAIQWSSESVGYLFGICSRFFLGALIASSIALFIGKRLPFHRKALLTYLAGGLGMSLAMLSVYWGSQYIPSGWVSIMFGFSPMMTGIMASYLLQERGLTFYRTVAVMMSLAGLWIMLETGMQYDQHAFKGILAVLLSALIYSSSMVAIKRVGADIDAFSSVIGTLLVAAVLFASIWLFTGMSLPNVIPERAGYAIIYLATVGSILGFLLFYYVLRRVEATRASLISLLSPVCALLLGHLVNAEPLNLNIVLGSVFILSGLLLYEFEVAICRVKTNNKSGN